MSKAVCGKMWKQKAAGFFRILLPVFLLLKYILKYIHLSMIASIGVPRATAIFLTEATAAILISFLRCS